MSKVKAAAVSMLTGVIFFLVIYPYGHDMYIAALHTALCVVLNGASTALFAGILFALLRGQFWTGEQGIYLWFLILLGIGHGLFAMMNWGSWVVLAITAVLLVAMLIHWVKKRK